MRPGSSTRATARARKCRWRSCTSPTRCTYAADVGIQLNGARGYSKDTILEWIYRYARQARLVDGASEVHNMVLARFMKDEGRDFWSWSAGNRV